MTPNRSSDHTSLVLRVAAIVLAIGALALAAFTLTSTDRAVARYLASGETSTALRSEFEAQYQSACMAETKQSVLAGEEGASARGIESHCGCAMDYFLDQAEVEDVRTMLERGEATSHAQLVQALARDHCLGELRGS